jgi:hypothetical protein
MKCPKCHFADFRVGNFYWPCEALSQDIGKRIRNHLKARDANLSKRKKGFRNKKEIFCSEFIMKYL